MMADEKEAVEPAPKAAPKAKARSGKKKDAVEDDTEKKKQCI